MPEDEFWRRYFFRVHQIEVEREKRKLLIEGMYLYRQGKYPSHLWPIESSAVEEDFAWEDEEDEATSPNRDLRSTGTAQKSPTSKLTVQGGTPGNTSPRESSEDSYDVVSGNASSVGDSKPDTSQADSDDGDSDWE